MKNRLLSLGLFVVFLLGVTAFPACGKKKPSEPKPETVTVYGEFYTVNEAYEKKYLMLDELNHISKNENTEGIFERLEEAQKEKILHDYKATHPIASEQLEIKKEYGIYRNCVVIWIHDPYYDNKLWETVIRYLVGDRKNPVTGFSSNFWQVRVWKECETPIEVEKPLKANGEFYSLEKAYEYGLLTEEDIEEIVKVPGTIIPPGGQEVSNKIIQDYRSFGMEGTDGFEIEYYGAFNDCIALSIGDLYYCDDGLQEGYAKFTIGAIEFWDRLPFFNVWKPIK